MAPIRRYLRITKYTVLECRIHVENPADATPRWLLNPREPILPRVFELIRPLVLPMLREENERERGARAKGKGKAKKRNMKEVLKAEDFEVAIYLTKPGTQNYSLLTKRKTFADKPKLKSTSSKMTGGDGHIVEIGDDEDQEQDAIEIREESDVEDDGAEKGRLYDIPAEPRDEAAMRRRRRRREAGKVTQDDALFVSEDSEDDTARPTKRARFAETPAGDGDDDKKKLALSTTYEGFHIHGWILCLIITRIGGPKRNNPKNPLAKASSTGRDASPAATAGQAALMDEWISSTQQQSAYAADDDG